MTRTTENFTLIAPLSCFPSANELDSMKRRERIAIKRKLKDDAHALALHWLMKRRIKPASINRREPLIKAPVRLRLTVFLAKGRTCDLDNLSVKHFVDKLVSMGIIADDSIRFIPEVVHCFGGFLPAGGYAEFCFEVMEG